VLGHSEIVPNSRWDSVCLAVSVLLTLSFACQKQKKTKKFSVIERRTLK
jgi:hypothetical protein